jgi:hypothetical protein
MSLLIIESMIVTGSKVVRPKKLGKNPFHQWCKALHFFLEIRKKLRETETILWLGGGVSFHILIQNKNRLTNPNQNTVAGAHISNFFYKKGKEVKKMRQSKCYLLHRNRFERFNYTS